MKKAYIKPDVSFHNLAISTSASAGCSVQASFQMGTCPIKVGAWGETVFLENNCDLSNDDFVCYDVPLSSSDVFES